MTTAQHEKIVIEIKNITADSDKYKDEKKITCGNSREDWIDIERFVEEATLQWTRAQRFEFAVDTDELYEGPKSSVLNLTYFFPLALRISECCDRYYKKYPEARAIDHETGEILSYVIFTVKSERESQRRAFQENDKVQELLKEKPKGSSDYWQTVTFLRQQYALRDEYRSGDGIEVNFELNTLGNTNYPDEVLPLLAFRWTPPFAENSSSPKDSMPAALSYEKLLDSYTSNDPIKEFLTEYRRAKKGAQAMLRPQARDRNRNWKKRLRLNSQPRLKRSYEKQEAFIDDLTKVYIDRIFSALNMCFMLNSKDKDTGQKLLKAQDKLADFFQDNLLPLPPIKRLIALLIFCILF